MLKNLKSQKGITLISLIVYVIVMLVVVTIIGTITSYFYANVNDVYQESKNENTEDILDMYLINDLKNKQVQIKTGELENVESDSKTINLIYNDKTSVIYTIADNNGIYRNSVKLYDLDSDDMVFTVGDIFASTEGSILHEKQELKIEKKIQDKENEIFKSYTVNVKTRLIYE